MSALNYPVPVGVDARAQISFIESALGLSDAELGKLVGVSRQAVAQWRGRGVPAERSAQVDRLVEFAQFLQRRLVPQRIPQIVRTAAKGLGGKTMLDVIRVDGVAPLYTYVARLAAYANT